ncbi:MAG: response regulator [Bacteroidota bacterium]
MDAQKVKIVIIDDEQDLCFLLSNMLLAAGYEVSSFNTLRSGIEAVKNLQPNWVIIDNNLPDGLGWDRVNEVIDLVPHVNIIKISASPDSFHSKPREFIHYLVKPIDVNSIVRLVDAQRVAGID